MDWPVPTAFAGMAQVNNGAYIALVVTEVGKLWHSTL
jgi:hypothetical protein